MGTFGAKLWRCTQYRFPLFDGILVSRPSSSIGFSPDFLGILPSRHSTPRRFASQIGSLKELEALLNPSKHAQVEPEQFEVALLTEYEFFKFNGQQVPKSMTDEQWEQIKKKRTVEERLELYRFYMIKENYRQKEGLRGQKLAHQKKVRHGRLVQKFGEWKDTDNEYDELGKSVLGAAPFCVKKIEISTARHLQNLHLSHALNFGQPLVFDLGVDYRMSAFESSCFRSQMREMYGRNRSHWEPFNLFLCNYDRRVLAHQKVVEDSLSESFLWNVTSKCFTEIFPRDKIVYLTRQSRVPLKKFYHDAVYVIGACVDGRFGRHDLAKVKEKQIAHAFFDLKTYFESGFSEKLPINQMFNALMDARDSDSNWVHSLRHFSRRFSRYLPPNHEMNYVKIPQDKTFVNRRSIFEPKKHDISRYEMFTPEELKRILSRDDDSEDEDHRKMDKEFYRRTK